MSLQLMVDDILHELEHCDELRREHGLPLDGQPAQEFRVRIWCASNKATAAKTDPLLDGAIGKAEVLKAPPPLMNRWLKRAQELHEILAKPSLAPEDQQRIADTLATFSNIPQSDALINGCIGQPV